MTHGYLVEPWCVTERGIDLDMLARSESVFALSNGHIGLRGNLDEGDPHGLPGTYLNSVYELRPLPYAEAGYGYPESGQTVINVTNGKLIRLLVDDEPFDIRYGCLDSHERVLDLRAGTLSRRVEWTSPAHDTVRVSSVRLVSLTQRAIVAIVYEVEPVDDKPLRIVLQSELVANEALPPQSKDPRAAAALENPLVSEEHAARNHQAVLVHRTRQSGLRVAAGIDHIVEGPEQSSDEMTSSPDVCRLTIATVLRPGDRLRVVKFVAYGWSSQRTRPALHDQVVAALAGRGSAAGTGFWPSSVPTSTSTGPVPTSRSTATPRCSRPCASGSSTSCRRAPGPSSARYRPRASPVPATTAIPSGTPRRSCCRC